MEFTKEQVGQRACHIRQAYRAGKLSTVEIAQYESLPEWNWASIDTVFLPFVEAQALARKHDIKGCRGYQEWDRPKGMPSEPHMIYKDSGWSGWSDFLGTVNLFGSKVFLSFTEARALMHKQGLQSKDEFYAWERPETIPSQPHVTYKDTGWAGWGDFLGTGNCRFLPFTKARALVQAQGLRSTYAFRNSNLEGVPSSPDKTYANKGWVSWSDWFGLSTEEHKVFLIRSSRVKKGQENARCNRKGETKCHI